MGYEVRCRCLIQATLGLLDENTYRILRLIPSREAEPVVGRRPNRPHQSAGLMTLPQAFDFESDLRAKQIGLTICSNCEVKPIVGSES